MLERDNKPDMVRDAYPTTAEGFVPRCTRIDIGCSGQNFYDKPDPNDPLGRCAPSAHLCGKHFFEGKDKITGLAVREDIGKLVDALSMTMDRMRERNKVRFPHKAYHNVPRKQRYNRYLREYLRGEHFRCEWITIQLKCLSRGDITKGHYDSLNCRYALTEILCMEMGVWNMSRVVMCLLAYLSADQLIALFAYWITKANPDIT
jgi:hypothetical protein